MDILSVVGFILALVAVLVGAVQMLFLGRPAARRMKLDVQSFGGALAESHHEITSLRQALGA